MLPNLPAPVRQFFVSEAEGDNDLLRTILTDDVKVHDEGEDHHGPDEVVAWLQRSREKYAATVTPLSLRQEGDDVAVLSRLEGNFPGSPVEATFNFKLAGDRIAGLQVG